MKTIRKNKPRFIIGAAIIFVFAGALAVTGYGASAQSALSCPFNAGANGIVIDFTNGATGGAGDGIIIANGTNAEARMHKSMTVPAGEYNLKLAAYDAHSEHGGQGQTQEQFFLRFRDADTKILLDSKPSGDIPENSDWFEGVVQTGLVVPEGVAIVQGFHAAWKTGSPESVTPVCAKLTPVSVTTPPPPTPSPEPLSCPFNAGANGIIIDFSNGFSGGLEQFPGAIIANGTTIEARLHGNFDIPAGTYLVKLAAHDAHSEHGGQGQMKEQYFLRALNANNNQLAITRPSHDIPENSDWFADVVQNEWVVPAGVKKVQAFHFAHPANGPESVTPVCAKLTPVSTPTPPPTPEPIECPLSRSGDQILIDFREGFSGGLEQFPGAIIANGTETQARLRDDRNIPAGTYGVTLVSHDPHSEHGGQGQEKERYHVRFKRSDNSLIAQTNATPDIPENEDVVISKVNTNFVLSESSIFVEAFHNAYPNSNPQSLTAVCMRLDPVEETNEETFLTVKKTVINDDGGTANVSDFRFFVNQEEVEHGVKNKFAPGAYTVSEINLPGYNAGDWGGDCADNGSVLLEEGDDAECTITNNDIPGEEPDITLTLVKHVINNDGGTATPNDFNLTINTVPITEPIVVQSNVPVSMRAGNYVVSEENLPGYVAGTWGGDCTPLGQHSGTITLEFKDNAVCTITNDDIATVSGANVFVHKSVDVNEKSLIDQTPFTYMLEYGNDGDTEAANVTITDTPSPTNILENYKITDDPEHGTCTELENGIECDLGVLDAGESGSITYTADIIGDTAGVVDNVVVIETPTTETTLVDNEDEEEVSVGLSDIVDVSIEKLVDGNESSSGKKGDEFTYTLTYRNLGQIPAEDVLLVDELATSTILEITEITKQADHTKPMDPTPCSIDGDKLGIECMLGTLEAGAVGTVTYTAVAIDTGVVDNLVVISASNEDDEFLDNNEDDARVTVTGNAPQADVAITKSVTPEGTQVTGSTFTYTLFYENLGNIDADDVTIDDTPESLGFLNTFSITKQPEHGSCLVKPNNEGILCDLGTLKSADSGTVVYTAKSDTEGSLVNTAIIDTTTGESNLDNNKDDAQINLSNGGGGCTSGCGGGGGGGTPRSRVSLFSSSDPLVAGVILSQVPYTGVGDVVQVILFLLALIVLSGVATYAVLRRRAGYSKTEPEHFIPDLEDTYDTEYESAVDAFEAEEIPTSSVLSLPHGDTLEAYARNKEILISPEAIQTLMERSEGDLGKAKRLLDETANIVRGRYPREDGWLPINKARVEEALGSAKVLQEDVSIAETPREMFETHAPVREQQSGTSVDVFIEWLVNGDSDKAFSFVRTMSRQKQSVKAFLGEAITLLDDAYRARTEGRNAHSQAVASMTAGLSLDDLEAIIEALTGAVDGSYKTPMTGVKVALARLPVRDRTQTTGMSQEKSPKNTSSGVPKVNSTLN